MDYRDQTIENQQIILDGNDYTGCTIRNCRIVYLGVQSFHAAACQFDGCAWAFDGPAARTIDFLKAMYRQEGMREVIEQTFDNIRNG